eukprot:m.49699 g.49699  ORF g.49699 m.49699 type:complete len:1133 (-) comp12095_c0_seq1:65-3463(-)
MVLAAAVPARTLPGSLVAENKSALAWGTQAVAYGCQNLVVVVDPHTAQVVQVLEGHGAPVTQVAWERNLHPRTLESPYGLRLVSGDTAGQIFVWDVVSGVPQVECVDHTVTKSKRSPRSVADLAWIPAADGEKEGHILVVHSPAPLALYRAGDGMCLWRADFGSDRMLSVAVDPFLSTRIVVQTETSLVLVNKFSVHKPPPEQSPKYSISGNSGEGSEVISVVFSPSCRDHLLLVYKREILTMDLGIHQTVSSIVLERGNAAFGAIAACSTQLHLYCLHDNGIISVRVRNSIADTFSFGGQSEPLRLGKNSRVFGVALDPFDDSAVASLTSDGRLYFYRYDQRLKYNLDTYAVLGKASRRVILMAMVDSVGRISCVQACQARGSTHLLAIGTRQGAIQLWDTALGTLQRQFQVHLGAVDGFHWAGDTQLVTYCSEDAGAGSFRNSVARIDLRRGKLSYLRDKVIEDTPVTGVSCSALEQYLLVVFRDKPLELWDLQSDTLLKALPVSFPVVAALAWSPPRSDTSPPVTGAGAGTASLGAIAGASSTQALPVSGSSVKEHFVVTTPDGHLCHFTVEGSIVRNGVRIQSEPSLASTTSLSWKGDYIVTGDTAGVLHFWSLKGRSSKSVSTGRGAIKGLSFNPGRQSHFLVLYSNGVDIWNAATQEAQSQRKVNKKDFSQVTSIAWASPDRPLLVINGATVQIFDAWLQTASCAVHAYKHPLPICAPYCFEPKVALNVKTFLQHQPYQSYQLPARRPRQSEDDASTQPLTGEALFASKVERMLQLLPKAVHDALVRTSSTADRCLVVAQFFGDEYEARFWTVVRHYLRHQDELWPEDPDATPSPSVKMADIRQLATSGLEEAGMDPTPPALPTEALPESFGLLRHRDAIYHSQLQSLALHENSRLNYDLASASTERNVLLGQHARATQLLLETDAKNPNFYTDSLRACIISAVASPSTCQNTIKLVAMNLIASGKLMEGVELLCLIGNGLDACRYLQTYGQWGLAARLAKSRLQPREAAEVLQRWVEHLAQPSVGKQREAAMVLVSFSQFKKALQMLLSNKRVDIACLLAQVLGEETNVVLRTPKPQRAANRLPAGPSLMEGIFAAYASHLRALGAEPSAKHFDRLAHGERVASR